MAMNLLTGPAGRALDTLTPVLDPVHVDAARARAIINGARGDVDRALGSARSGAFSAELHAASRNMRGGDVSGGVAGVLDSFDELGRAARGTALKRTLVGALAIGGAIGGAMLLSRAFGGGGDSQPMAPGPFNPLHPHRDDRFYA